MTLQVIDPADIHASLITDRLVMRPLRLSDATDFAALVDNPAICRMTGTFPSPFPAISVLGKIEIFCARAATGHSYHWTILEDDHFAGVIGIYRTQTGWDLGYWLGEPFWGRGLAHEAVSRLIQHLQTSLSELRMSACVFTDNPASANLLLKVGFVQDDTVCDGYSLARRKTVPNWTFNYVGRSKANSKTVTDAQVCCG